MSDTKIEISEDRVTVTTGELKTVFRRGDDEAAATQVASLQSHVVMLRADRDEQIKRLRKELSREIALRRTYRVLPEQYHRGMLELLVKAAFEAAEISHGRAAELLGCSTHDIREKGWVQGRMEEEVWRLTAHLLDIRHNLLHEDGTANVAEVQEILERALGVEES